MIATLSDPLALRLLSIVAGPRLLVPRQEAPSAADLLAALSETFGSLDHQGPSPSDADLARAALALAADDPATAGHIEAMIEQAPPPVMGLETTILAVAAAVAILKTELTVERTAAGKWKILLIKKPATDSLLKGLAHVLMKVLAARPGAGDGDGLPRLPK